MLPTKAQVSTLQYSANGSPWANIAAKPSIDVDTLEFSADGSPWWGVEDTPTGGVKWDSILLTSVSSLNSKAISAVQAINGINI